MDCKDGVKVKILFFARAREIAGCRESQLTLPACLNSHALKDHLVRHFKLEIIKDTFILAINEVFVEDEKSLLLKDRDEIAIIPPLSGGKIISLNWV